VAAARLSIPDCDVGLLTPGQSIVTGEVVLPRLVVRQSALEHNIARMALYCHEHDVLLAPHAKTTMAPGIVRRQWAAGVWGFTVATVVQAHRLRRLGVSRILIANQLVEPRAIAWIAHELSQDPHAEMFVLADSIPGVARLNSVLETSRLPRPLGVLIELGEIGGRAGCRTDAEALEVARAIESSPHLRLVGLEGFEALLAPDVIRPFLRRVRALMETLAHRQGRAPSEELIMSVGSTEYIEPTVEELTGWESGLRVRTLLRPGGYATNSIMPGYLRPLEIWSAVVSRPEPGLAIAGFGRRDVPAAEELPTPIAAASGGQIRSLQGRAMIRRLFDQHALVELAGEELDIGEVLGCSLVSPYSPAFATWRSVPIVDDRHRVVEVLDVLY